MLSLHSELAALVVSSGITELSFKVQEASTLIFEIQVGCPRLSRRFSVPHLIRRALTGTSSHHRTHCPNSFTKTSRFPLRPTLSRPLRFHLASIPLPLGGLQRRRRRFLSSIKP